MSRNIQNKFNEWNEIFNELKQSKNLSKFEKKELILTNENNETLLHALLNVPNYVLSRSDKYNLFNSFLYTFDYDVRFLNKKDKFGNNVLHIICKNHYSEIIKLIYSLQKKEKINVSSLLLDKNNIGISPFEYILKGKIVKCNDMKKEQLIKFKKKNKEDVNQFLTKILDSIEETNIKRLFLFSNDYKSKIINQ